MSKVCEVTGKGPMSGNTISHSNRKTRRRFLPNVHNHRFFVPSQNRFVTLKVSSKGMKTIDKYGIEAVLEKIRLRDLNLKAK
jgi:large subunit ribosomal protein L28